MTRVKICGITNAEDARAAVEFGADMLGFIFVPESPRYVGADLPTARRLLQDVPAHVTRVGVFDALPDDLSGLPELEAVQYYRSAASGRARPVPIKAYRIKDETSLQQIDEDESPRSMILLDAYSPNALGGTGHTFNWEFAGRAERVGLPVILAGGLTPDNVAEAIAAVRPWAVDVSSGVEAEPGRKDHDKLRRFIEAVRQADIELARDAPE